MHLCFSVCALSNYQTISSWEEKPDGGQVESYILNCVEHLLHENIEFIKILIKGAKACIAGN